MSDFISNEITPSETNGIYEQSSDQQKTAGQIGGNELPSSFANVKPLETELEEDTGGTSNNLLDDSSTSLIENEDKNDGLETEKDHDLHEIDTTNHSEDPKSQMECENAEECSRTQLIEDIDKSSKNDENSSDVGKLGGLDISVNSDNQTADCSAFNKNLSDQHDELNELDLELACSSNTADINYLAEMSSTQEVAQSNNTNETVEVCETSEIVQTSDSTAQTGSSSGIVIVNDANSIVQTNDLANMAETNEGQTTGNEQTDSSKINCPIASSSEPRKAIEEPASNLFEPDDSDPDEELIEDAILGPYSNEDCDENVHTEDPEYNFGAQYESATESDNESAEAIIADEYILTELPEHTESNNRCKRRRRILMYNDGQSSESSDFDEDREKIRSPSPSNSLPSIVDSNLKSGSDSEYDSNDSMCNIIIENERPGPRSSKQSTKILNEIDARTLLKNAVIIPIQSDATKRKKRIIDSDDEDNDDDIRSQVSLDDIGITESHDQVFVSDDDVSQSAGVKHERNDNHLNASKIRVKPELNLVTDVESLDLQIERADGDTKNYTQIVEAIKLEPICELHEEKQLNRDSGNSTDSVQKQYQLVKNELDIPLNTPLFGDLSSSDDGLIPNEVYFGAPVRNNNSITRKRGRYPGDPRFSNGEDSTGSNNSIEQKLNLNYSYNPKNINWNNFLPSSSQKKKKKRKQLPNELYFDSRVPLHVLHAYDDSSSDEPAKEPAPNPTFKEAMAALNKCRIMQMNNRRQIQPSRNSIANRPQQRSQQQRPQQQRRPQQRSRQKQRKPQKKPQKQQRKTSPAHKPEQTNPFDSNEDSLIKTMKMYLNVAGLKRVNLNKLCTGCSNSEERANRILNLLHEKGLQGEPTVEKCKQLRKDLRIRREIEGLDPNVIIQGDTEGRTRRSSTRATPRPKYTFDEDEPVQETLKKIRQIIDTDSETD